LVRVVLVSCLSMALLSCTGRNSRELSRATAETLLKDYVLKHEDACSKGLPGPGGAWPLCYAVPGGLGSSFDESKVCSPEKSEYFCIYNSCPTAPLLIRVLTEMKLITRSPQLLNPTSGRNYWKWGCPISLTKAGEKRASGSGDGRSMSFGQFKFIRVTGVTNSAPATAVAEWEYVVVLNDLGLAIFSAARSANLDFPPNGGGVIKSSAMFQKYDDGWRLK
jgi:hypothetical protein